MCVCSSCSRTLECHGERAACGWWCSIEAVRSVREDHGDDVRANLLRFDEFTLVRNAEGLRLETMNLQLVLLGDADLR